MRYSSDFQQLVLLQEEAEKLKYPNVKSFLKHMSKGRTIKSSMAV